MGEPDIIEIWVNPEDKGLLFVIPATGDVYEAQLGSQLKNMPKRSKKIIQVNLDEIEL